MEEEKKEELKLFPGINKELFEEVTKVLEKYPIKDIFYTLWYILMTLSVSIVETLDKKKS